MDLFYGPFHNDFRDPTYRDRGTETPVKYANYLEICSIVIKLAITLLVIYWYRSETLGIPGFKVIYK